MSGKIATDKERMLKEHLRERGITNERVLDSFSSIPREEFVLRKYRDLSYVDQPLPIGEGQTISQPYTVAFMTELLSPQAEDTVLEIGAGSGYQAAILSVLVKKVYTVECVVSLAKKAQATLKRLGFDNVEVSIGDGSSGLPKHAPYEGIIVTAASPEIPPPLFKQLKEGGRLVIPVGGDLLQDMTRILKTKEGSEKTIYPGFRFVPLVGEYGFSSG
jgi:protein-L-isoaspartate(D-aspartate) O-methyltransferase